MDSGYEDLADEYYDERAHPTIALLRAGSFQALERMAPEFLAAGERFAEIGSGRGMLNALGRGRSVVSFDLNAGMLKQVAGIAVIADANMLPVTDASFDGVFASLCDPYNTLDFLREAARVLKPGGRLLMTVPNYVWVRHNQAKEGVIDAAVVVSESGRLVVPSYVHDPVEQVGLLEDHGFAAVQVAHIPLADVTVSTGLNSPRLLDASGAPVSSSVVDAYLARRTT